MFRVKVDRESPHYKKSVPYVLTGLLLEVVGGVSAIFEAALVLALLFEIVGAVLLAVGLYYFARSKNRSVAWAGLAVFSLFGWFLLAYLPEGDPPGRLW